MVTIATIGGWVGFTFALLASFYYFRVFRLNGSSLYLCYLEYVQVFARGFLVHHGSDLSQVALVVVRRDYQGKLFVAALYRFVGALSSKRDLAVKWCLWDDRARARNSTLGDLVLLVLR